MAEKSREKKSAAQDEGQGEQGQEELLRHPVMAFPPFTPVLVTAQRVPFYAEPDEHSKVVGEARMKEVVPVIQAQGPWLMTVCKFDEAWFQADWVERVEQDAPTVTFANQEAVHQAFEEKQDTAEPDARVPTETAAYMDQADGYGMMVMPGSQEELFAQAYAELVFAFEPNAEMIGTYSHIMNVFSPDTVVELQDYIAIPAQVEAGGKTGEGPAAEREQAGAKRGSARGVDRLRPSSPMMAMAMHGAHEELDALYRQLGTLQEVAPQVAAMAQASWGEDVGNVAVVQDPTLEARGKRGVAADGDSLRVAPGGERNEDLLLEEAAHVVQHRNRARSRQRSDGRVGRLESEARGAVDAARSGQRASVQRAASMPLYQDDTAHEAERAEGGLDQEVEARIAQALSQLEVLRNHALAHAEELAWPAVEAQHDALRSRVEALQAGFVERAAAMRLGGEQAQAQAQIHASEGAEGHADEARSEQAEASSDLERLAQQALGELEQIPLVIEPLLERGRYDALLQQKERELLEQAQQMRDEIEQRARRAQARAEDDGASLEAVEQARAAAQARVDEVEAQLREGLDAMVFARGELLSARMATAAETLSGEPGALAALVEEVQHSASHHESQLEAASTRVDLAYTRFTVVIDHQATAESVEQRVDPLGLVAEVIFVEPGDGSGEGQEVVTIPDRHSAKLAEQIARLEGFHQLTIDTMVEGIKAQDPTNLDNLVMAAVPFAIGPVLKAAGASRRLLALIEQSGADDAASLRQLAREKGMADADELADLVNEARRLPHGQQLSPDRAERLADLFRRLDLDLRPAATKAIGKNLTRTLKSFRTKEFRFGSETYTLQKDGFEHILVRHHPRYWDGSRRPVQSFFDEKMSVDDILDAMESVMKQNRETLMNPPNRAMFQISGVFRGQEYTLGLNHGRIRQFYPG